MTVNDAPPPDPHEDRLSRARERMATDYDDEPSTPRRDRRSGKKAMTLGSLLPADKTTRMLTYGAAGLGALLMVGIGGWSLIGHRQSGIPVFGPPPEPIREKPLDPGGMELNGMMPPPVDTEQQGSAHLAPAPEQPNPEALAARYGEKAKDEAPAQADAGSDAAPGQAPSDAAGAPAAGPDAGAAAGGKALPSEETTTPAPAEGDDAAAQNRGSDSAMEEAPAAAQAPVREEQPKAAAKSKPVATEKPAEKPTPRPAAATASGPYGVQLAALNSEDAARKEWDRLKAVSPDLFAGHSPVIEKTVHTNAIFYRLRTRGFDSVASARAFCDSLREHGHACNVLRP